MGMQLHLQALLSLYRFFASALISVSLPVRKKKLNSLSVIPVLNSSSYTKEYGKKELRSQMGSVLNNSLLLQYIDCVIDESVSLRSYYGLSQILQEERELGGSMSSVSKLLHYVGWLSTTAVHVESNRTFLLHFILDFYEKVCDTYIHYNLPLVVVSLPGILYSVLCSLDANILNQRCFIMSRYRKNLTAAKKNVWYKSENAMRKASVAHSKSSNDMESHVPEGQAPSKTLAGGAPLPERLGKESVTDSGILLWGVLGSVGGVVAH
ncbi:centromere protein I-like isoform X2 [Macaca nemestrina]|uniref:centromere protein I-like isoform X2 n=1 Tax=Macaca nemestrina TaxID=9545 RepID=UPI0039B98324